MIKQKEKEEWFCTECKNKIGKWCSCPHCGSEKIKKVVLEEKK